MRRDFNTRAFGFTHRLHESPLFELPRLARLAEYLLDRGGRRDVYNAAVAQDVGSSFNPNGQRDWRPGKAIEQIETSGSWMVLKRIEQDPDYKRLVDACVREIRAAVPEYEPQRLQTAEGFVFVTSPRGITPYHIDPQWSFLAQIRGVKTYRIYDARSGTIVSTSEIEDYYSGITMAARYDPRKDCRAQTFTLRPGQAANQPLLAPHSAEVADEYSISFSLAIETREWRHKVPTHLANRWLRRFGIQPAPVGVNPALDSVKGFAYRVGARLRREFDRLPKRVREA